MCGFWKNLSWKVKCWIELWCHLSSYLWFSLFHCLRNGPMVEGWGLWSRDPGSIPCAGSCFWFGYGAPHILARYLQNGTKISEGPMCVCTPHTQSKYGYSARFEYYSLRFTLERIILSALRDQTRLCVASARKWLCMGRLWRPHNIAWALKLITVMYFVATWPHQVGWS